VIEKIVKEGREWSWSNSKTGLITTIGFDQNADFYLSQKDDSVNPSFKNSLKTPSGSGHPLFVALLNYIHRCGDWSNIESIIPESDKKSYSFSINSYRANIQNIILEISENQGTSSYQDGIPVIFTRPLDIGSHSAVLENEKLLLLCPSKEGPVLITEGNKTYNYDKKFFFDLDDAFIALEKMFDLYFYKKDYTLLVDLAKRVYNK